MLSGQDVGAPRLEMGRECYRTQRPHVSGVAFIIGDRPFNHSVFSLSFRPWANASEVVSMMCVVR